MEYFGLKLSQDLGNRAAHPYEEFRGVHPRAHNAGGGGVFKHPPQRKFQGVGWGFKGEKPSVGWGGGGERMDIFWIHTMRVMFCNFQVTLHSRMTFTNL